MVAHEHEGAFGDAGHAREPGATVEAGAPLRVAEHVHPASVIGPAVARAEAVITVAHVAADLQQPCGRRKAPAPPAEAYTLMPDVRPLASRDRPGARDGRRRPDEPR